MSSDSMDTFSKNNLDTYLKELAKEYRRLSGKSVPAEIILVGGGAIIAGYGFREMTTDIDAVIHASSSMKDAIDHVGDKYDLPNNWLNADFTETSSYSKKLDEYSVYYRTFSNIVTVRVMQAQYLIAMKLRSGRLYKNDLSDIAGILAEHAQKGTEITLDQIREAYKNLYGNWDEIPESSGVFIESVMSKGNYEEIFRETKENEERSKKALIEFENEYPGTLRKNNVNDILKMLKGRK